MAGTDRTKGPPRGQKEEPSPVIILVEPQLGQNIGMCARAMGNMGLENLRLVAPREGWPNDWATKAAAGADWILQKAQIYQTTAEAVADLKFVYATTARSRDMVKQVRSPREAAPHMREIIQGGGGVGILFGREKAGLKNDDIVLADEILMAPVSPGFASLNLAQAVLLFGYEWLMSGKHSFGDNAYGSGSLDETGLQIPGSSLATKEELMGLFEHLEGELDQTGFLLPVEKRPAMVRNLRNMLQRAKLSEQEVRTFRGVVKALTHHNRRKRKDEE